MKIKKILLCGMITFLTFMSFTDAENEICTSDILMECLLNMEGEFLEGDINFGGDISDKFMDKEEIIKILDDIKEDIGVKGENNIIVEDDFTQAILSGMDKENRPITISLTSYKNAEIGRGKTSLFIDITALNKDENYYKLEKDIQNIFKKFDTEAEISTCIIGTFKGELSKKEIQEKIEKGINSIEGTEKEMFENENIISISSYVPSIHKNIYSGNKKMNLNVAMRYNEYEGKTYVWIGSPIVTLGY